MPSPPAGPNKGFFLSPRGTWLGTMGPGVLAPAPLTKGHLGAARAPPNRRNRKGQLWTRNV